MPDTDPDTDRERASDPRLDHWPVPHDGDYADWPVERTVPGEDDAAPETDEEVEWIGFLAEGKAVAGPVLYDPETPAVVRGELDEENERVVLGEDHERREVESDDSLGEHIEAFGEEHGWSWLSSFAREYLEDDDLADEGPRGGPTLEYTEFDRRNLGASDSQDLAFFGSHTFADATDRVYTLEREFDVYLDGADDGRAVVAVEEELRVAREPREEDRAGDTELVDERGYEFAVDVDTDDPSWESDLEWTLDEWHADHPEPRRDG